MSKKFPYLNITQVSETAASSKSGAGSPKPMLSVKPSSQLLKPGAMTNMSAVAANKPATVTSTTANKAAANKMTNMDARNKLAMFKAQVCCLITF